jgi:hypothetical protein
MKNLVLLLLICSTFLQCRKEEKPIVSPPSEPQYQYIPECIKPFEVKANSYWVYENDSTGVKDSVGVLSTETGMLWTSPAVHGQGGGTQSEYYKINLKSYLNSTLYNDFILNYVIKRNGGGLYGQDGQVIYLANGTVGTSFYGMEISSKLSTLNVNGITFNNITKIKVTAANQYLHVFTNDTYLYYVDTVGLIKKETVLGVNNIESWSIKRWRTVK